ncbi:MAG: hypothetical protein O3B09_04435 [Proteobacteria bacterium]|nr:hypothetical protein [Pseudomonadota bacterium]
MRPEIMEITKRNLPEFLVQIASMKVDDPNRKELMDQLKGFLNTLKSINLSLINLRYVDVKVLAEGLKENSTLKSINLSYNEIGNEDVLVTCVTSSLNIFKSSL